MKTINIGTEFSDTPLGRVPTDGPCSGERFREEFLTPALKTNETIQVEIADAEGYGSSFLEEAFGGLVRKRQFTARDLHKKLQVTCRKPAFTIYKDLIWKYIDEAKPE